MSSIALIGRTYRQPGASNAGTAGERERSNRASMAFRVIIVVLATMLAGELVFHLIVAPRLMIRQVDIVSDAELRLDDASLLAIAKLTEQPYYFSVDPVEVAERLESYASIQSARVEKAFPDTLKIRVTGRKPLAIALVEQSGRSVPVAFDREGVVFQIGTSVDEYDLPIVSGLTFADVRLGQRIARPLIGFLESLETLRISDPVLFSLISELKFVKKNRSDFEVVLFPRDYPIRVRLGSEISSDLMKRIVLVLDVFSRQGVDNIREIDFRTDDIVMQVRGE